MSQKACDGIFLKILFSKDSPREASKVWLTRVAQILVQIRQEAGIRTRMEKKNVRSSHLVKRRSTHNEYSTSQASVSYRPACMPCDAEWPCPTLDGHAMMVGREPDCLACGMLAPPRQLAANTGTPPRGET